MANKTYLVTGAAGFIGAAVAQRFIDQGHQVVTIDNLSTGYENHIPEGVTFIKGDCFDAEIIGQLETFSFDAILHIAGQSSGEISFENPTYDLQTNTQSTLMLLDFAKKKGIKNFIYASTMSVYGDQMDKPISEKETTRPKSFYGVGKLASEDYLRIYADFGIRCTALRLFNVYGPGQNLVNMKQGMVSIFMAQALNDNKILVKGDKNRFRDFVYIDDVVNSFALFAAKPTSAYACYNIASGVKTTVENLVHQIVIAHPSPVDVRYEGSTPGDQFGIYGDARFIADQVGWKAQIDFKTGMKRMYDWAKNELD